MLSAVVILCFNSEYHWIVKIKPFFIQIYLRATAYFELILKDHVYIAVLFNADVADAEVILGM